MERNNSIFWEAAAVIVSLACFVVSWKVFTPRYRENKIEIIQLDQEITAANKKLDSLNVAKNSIDNLGSTIDQMFIAVPKDKDTANVITELEALAIKYKTYIPSIQITDGAEVASTQVTPDATQAAAGSSTVAISFTVNGTFEDLSGLIASLENNIKFFNIQGITFTSGDDQMSLAIQAQAFKQVSTSLSDPSALLSANSSEAIQ